MRRRKHYREQMIEAVVRVRRRPVRTSSSKARPITERRDRRGPSQGDHRAEDLPGDLRHRHSRTKACRTLLDAVVDYLPSPLEVPPVEGTSHRRSRAGCSSATRDDSEPFAALVFKIMTDPFVGQLAFIRVYSGKLKAGESVYNVAKAAAGAQSAAW